MILIDSHCHLTSEPLASEVGAVIERAVAAGVTRMITVGVDAGDNAAAIRLAEQHAGVYAAVGIHPHEAAKATADDVARLAELYAHPRVVAAGEIGLDYHYEFSDRATQKRVFAEQLELARRAGMPVVIHSRKAFEDTVAILRECQCADTPVVFHCFGGSAEQFAVLDRFGWRASFTGSVTFKNARPLQELVRHYPGDRIMLETDAPYLTPEPIRRVKPNEPGYLTHVAEFLARLRGVSIDELAAQTAANTEAFFNLPAD
jgi:TatD DNase family protein